MSQLDPFKPNGNTFLVSGTTTAALSTAACGGTAMRVVNQSSAVTAYVAFGSSTIAAVVPSSATPGVGAPVLPLTSQVFGMAGSQSWVSVIASSAAGASVNYTPGTGGF